ncbi:MAG: ATP-binding cassette domain-containing protein [Flavonifractor plautii]
MLCGPSGCGKSTLLRQLKTVLAPHGRRLGSIRFEGCPLEELDQREQSAGIGFVQTGPRKPDCHRQGVARTRLWPGEPGV